MNEQELQDIEKREQAATPGPWTMKQDGADFYMADSKGQYLDITLADAIFASHARQDIPALIADVRRLKEYIEQSERANQADTKLAIGHIKKLNAGNARLLAEVERLKGAIATALSRSRKEEWGPVIDVLGEALIYPRKFEDGPEGGEG